jgi:hypothetical protein
MARLVPNARRPEDAFGLNADLPISGTMAMVVASTVILSILFHGITANPWASAYGGGSRDKSEC